VIADIGALPPQIQTKIQLELCPVAGLDGFCWAWTGRLNHGYSSIYFAGRTQPAHRVTYELLVGPIPSGLQIDHLCVNRPCLNPAHLEPVTARVNTQRALCPDWRCPQGHPLADPNLIVKRRPNGVTIHNCRVCAMDYHRKRRGGKGRSDGVRRRALILVAAEDALQQVAA
jgi:HNH endonuclease